MKKSLVIGVGGVLLITGCCCRPVDTCANNSCMDDNQVEMPITQQNNVESKEVKQNIQNTENSCVISQKNYKKSSCIKTLTATGIGVAPVSGAYSQPQALAMARRAAILDAYKSLAEQLYGIKINGKETVKNMVLQNSDLKAYVSGLIRGANIEEENYKNGMYKVTMSIKINVKEWNKYLQNMSAY